MLDDVSAAPEPRLDHFRVDPEAMQAMLSFEQAVRGFGLEKSLYELVKIRASQINGCAFCLHMHARDAADMGETPARLHLLAAWRDSGLYTPRERAALAWTEALTRLSEGHPSDAAFEALRAAFTEQECVRLTALICAINSWNRFGAGFRAAHPIDTDDLPR